MIISSANPPHTIMDDVDLRSDMDSGTLVQKCEILGGIPRVFKAEPELLESFIVGLRADLKALETYNPPPRKEDDKIAVTATVLYSDNDYIIDPGKMEDWRLYLDCKQFIRFPGHHFYLFEPSNRGRVIAIINDHLNI